MDIGLPAENGTATSVVKVSLQPFDYLTQQVIASKYRITWTYASGGKPTTCNLKVVDGDQFSFTVTDHAIAVTKKGFVPTRGADLVVATSSLCAP
jgi:hypothetical protein